MMVTKPHHLSFVIIIVVLCALGSAQGLVNCNSNEWKCSSVDLCINATQKCDGIENCPDGSDEELKNCPLPASTNLNGTRFKRQFQQYATAPVNLMSCQIPPTNNMRVFDNSASQYNDVFGFLRPGATSEDGSTIFYKCPDGLVLKGPENNICIERDWISPLPSCQVKSGCAVPELTNGIVSYPNSLKGFKVGHIIDDSSNVVYTCANNYELVGSSNNICLYSEWLNPHPTCQYIEPVLGCRMENIPNVIASYKYEVQGIKPNELVRDSSTITYHCQSGYILHGVHENICFDDSWTSAHPVCEMPGAGCRVHDVPNLNVFNDGKIVQPGQYIENLDSVSYACARHHFSVGASSNTCINDTWQADPPSCNRYCPNEFLRSHTFQALCKYRGKRVNCEDIIRSDTQAYTDCRLGYKEKDVTLNNVIVCEDGKWYGTPKKCVPDCGIESHHVTGFINSGNESEGIVTWHVGVYKKQVDVYDLKCGGTIISSKVVISAAHCFWDDASGKQYDKDSYSIAAGKRKRGYNDVADIKVQKSNILELHIPDSFVRTTFYSDIAVIILSQQFVFDTHIKAACLDLNLFNSRSPAVYNGQPVFLAGWGIVDTGENSQVLVTALMRSLSRDTCIKEKHWTPAEDQFCAGAGPVTACKGDSGGGLLLLNEQRIFYMWGIVSNGAVGQATRTCIGEFQSSYTDILQHKSFIQPIIYRYSPEVFPDLF